MKDSKVRVRRRRRRRLLLLPSIALVLILTSSWWCPTSCAWAPLSSVSFGYLKTSQSPSCSKLLSVINDDEEKQPSAVTPPQHRPSVSGVTLKIALDANGGAADLQEQAEAARFTCAESLDMVHRLRCDSDAVLVGRRTVVADDPSLTVRRIPCQGRLQPLRIVLDPCLSLIQEEALEDYQLFRDGLPTVVYHCVRDVDDSLLDLDECVTCVYIPPAETSEQQSDLRLPLKQVIKNLTDRFQIDHLMVEGGPLTARLFLEEELIDRAIIVKAPLCFRKPLESGISDEILEQAGLKMLGTCTSGVDQMECWSRPDLAWPTEELSDWP